MSLQAQQDGQVDYYSEEESYSITAGSIISETFDVFVANAPSFLSIVFLCVSPAILFMMLQILGFAPMAALLKIGSSLGQLLIIPAQGAVVFGTVRYMAGDKPSMNENLSRGFSSFLSVIVVSIVVGLIVMFGLMLFVIPGILLLMNYFIVIPVTVVERGSAGDNMRRSKELVKGFRFKIFLAAFVIAMMQSAVSGGLMYGLFAFFKTSGTDSTMAMLKVLASPTASLATFVVTILFSALYATMSAVMYVRLREVHDNVNAVELAQVFE